MNAEALLEETNDPVLQRELLNDKSKMLIRAWQKRQRDLLVKKLYLKREYRRESPSKLAQDLGVSIELKRLQNNN